MPRSKIRAEGVKAPPRIAITVTPRQWETFRNFLPYGFQRQVFQAVIEDMCQMWDEFGDDFTRALLAKNLTYRQFMGDYMERTYGDIGEPKETTLPRNELGGTIGSYQEYSGTQEDENRTKEEIH